MLRKKITTVIALVMAFDLTLISGCGASTPADTDNQATASTDSQNVSDQPEGNGGNNESDVASETDTSPSDAGSTEETDEDPSDAADNASGDAGSGEAADTDTGHTELSEGITMPELNIPDLKVPELKALAFVRDMGVGFNLGNTFDAYLDPTPADEMSTETCWHGTYTTKEMIKDIHEYGFDTIRIPVSWHNHVDGDVNISAQWLDRVNEVVDWAYDEGMYVIINIHHDNHLEAEGLYPDKEHLDRSRKYVSRVWEQLSERFKDYDEHLIFEAMNEPRLVGTGHEWDFNTDYDDCREAIDCINELNQLFVDTVRASGGNNASRYLMCPGYAASMDGGTNPFFELPRDIDGNESKIMLSIHAYTPYNFALEYPGVSDFDVDNKERTTDISSFMNRLYMDYVTQGVPVVIGEFGCRDKNGNLQDRVNYSAYFVAMAKARNIACVWWDNNAFMGDGELFGIYNRKEPEKTNTDIIAALMEYK